MRGLLRDNLGRLKELVGRTIVCPPAVSHHCLGTDLEEHGHGTKAWLHLNGCSLEVTSSSAHVLQPLVSPQHQGFVICTSFF